MTLFLSLIITLLAVWYLDMPLGLADETRHEATDSSSSENLLRVAQLKEDLEHDYRTGKIDQADYLQLKQTFD